MTTEEKILFHVEKKASPKKEKEVLRGRGDGGRGSDMKVAPTQQVTVAGGGQAGLGQLVAKIDQLLKENRESKRKAAGKKAYGQAKKQYRAYRKKMVGVPPKDHTECDQNVNDTKECGTARLAPRRPAAGTGRA